MKVIVQGSGAVNLGQNHFVAAGGQASVYVKDGTAYKIYADPKHTIPYAKFQLLAKVADPCVIKPERLLLGAKNTPIGYSMRAVTDNYSLCQLFTRAFRDRYHISHAQVLNVAAKLREHITQVHAAGVLIVDLNELNILVSKSFDEAYLIDVDSYQTPGFPATVILPSVRDYSVRSADFSPLSDWFSYAVLAFQLFIGSHPYKGSHPGSAHIPKEQRLVYRMQHHISAFRSDVALPKCCYALDTIPQDFRDWLRRVLDGGERIPAPDPRGGPAVTIAGATSRTAAVPVLVSGNLLIQEALDFEGWHVEQYVESGGNTLALVSNGSEVRVVHNGRVVYASAPLAGETLIGFTPRLNMPIAFNLYNGRLCNLSFADKKVTEVELEAEEFAKSGERFYVRSGSQVLEVEFAELSGQVLVSASHPVAHVLERASRLFEGCVVQNMLGSIFVSLFPRSRAGYQVRVPELDAYKIVDAKFDAGVLMVIGARDGVYDRLIFRFTEDYAAYDLRTAHDVSNPSLNFVVLASGVCVSLTDDENLDCFSARNGSQMRKIVTEPALGSDLRLLTVGGKPGFERGGKLCQMSLRA